MDGLFNGHIAIFGNTGSGKSNTLASLFQELVSELRHTDCRRFMCLTRFIVFDFNGEFGGNCFTSEKDEKKVYELSTDNKNGQKIPMRERDMLDLELLSILSEATVRTQKPFLTRTKKLYNRYMNNGDSTDAVRRAFYGQIKKIFKKKDKDLGPLLLEHVEKAMQLCPNLSDVDLTYDVSYNSVTNGFYMKHEFTGQNEGDIYFGSHENLIKCTRIWENVKRFNLSDNVLNNFLVFVYLRLIEDIQDFNVQNDHIAPMVHRLRTKIDDLNAVFVTSDDDGSLWPNRCNFVVIDLSDLNPGMKKTVPLILSKWVYTKHKRFRGKRSLNIIIDEAHQILSRESFREEETLKDYRLETFEEIIKEGRKFGVFVTLASQRPHDISHTITSQAHNYFIHRLVNQRDLESIAGAVSYIDKLSHQSIPTLPIGTCIFSGVASRRPIKVRMKRLKEDQQPQSKTLRFNDLMDGNAQNGTSALPDKPAAKLSAPTRPPTLRPRKHTTP